VGPPDTELTQGGPAICSVCSSYGSLNAPFKGGRGRSSRDQVYAQSRAVRAYPSNRVRTLWGFVTFETDSEVMYAMASTLTHQLRHQYHFW
jgi:hypothetical protein